MGGGEVGEGREGRGEERQRKKGGYMEEMGRDMDGGDGWT